MWELLKPALGENMQLNIDLKRWSEFSPELMLLDFGQGLAELSPSQEQPQPGSCQPHSPRLLQLHPFQQRLAEGAQHHFI